MRLLFVSTSGLQMPRGGRAMLGNLHRDAMLALLSRNFAAYRLPESGGMVLSLAGYLDGAAPRGIAAALTAVEAHAADTVWLDGSNLGRLAQALRRARPSLRILTFCHNVEARFFLGALRRGRSVRSAGVLVGNYVAERLAVRHSDDIVALSARDSDGLAQLYGRAADHILPMAVADQLASPPPAHALVAADAPLLFVGGAFYANQAGIAWFAREVAPRIDARIAVIGQGMESMRAKLETAPNVRVLGPVDLLEPHYRAARVAIAPIFDGSGMKTKVAEAMMFGKRVIGTAEAFSGYEALGDEAGWRCDTADAFARAIRSARAMEIKALDPELRALYERGHSERATERRLAAILGRPTKTKLNETI